MAIGCQEVPCVDHITYTNVTETQAASTVDPRNTQAAPCFSRSGSLPRAVVLFDYTPVIVNVQHKEYVRTLDVLLLSLRRVRCIVKIKHNTTIYGPVDPPDQYVTWYRFSGPVVPQFVLCMHCMCRRLDELERPRHAAARERAICTLKDARSLHVVLSSFLHPFLRFQFFCTPGAFTNYLTHIYIIMWLSQSQVPAFEAVNSGTVFIGPSFSLSKPAETLEMCTCLVCVTHDGTPPPFCFMCFILVIERPGVDLLALNVCFEVVV